MKFIKKIVHKVKCYYGFHEGFHVHLKTIDNYSGHEFHNEVDRAVCKHCKQEFEYNPEKGIGSKADKELVRPYYLQTVKNLVEDPEKLSSEDRILIKICNSDLYEYSEMYEK